MSNRYASLHFLGVFFWLICVSPQKGHANPPDLPITFQPVSLHGGMIRIAGKLVERASQRPLRQASIMVKCGDMVLANQQSDDKGAFILYIPPEKISQAYLSIKVKYMNHVFLKDHIEPLSQDMLIEINGAVFLERNPIQDYKLPTHKLGQPQVGRVLIRTRNYRRNHPQKSDEIRI